MVDELFVVAPVGSGSGFASEVVSAVVFPVVFSGVEKSKLVIARVEGCRRFFFFLLLLLLGLFGLAFDGV